MLLRMRVEEASQTPPNGDSAIDVCILIDRGVDLVTPLMTQLTYEGLMDEVLGIHNGSVVLEHAAGACDIQEISSTHDSSFRQQCTNTVWSTHYTA